MTSTASENRQQLKAGDGSTARAKKDLREVSTSNSGTRAERVLLGAVAVAIVLAGWALLAALNVWSPLILPSPLDVGREFRTMFSSADIWVDLRASGEELLYGFGLAAVVGVAIGIPMGWYRRLGYMIDPLVNFAYSVPRIALSPLLLIWLGVGLSSKVALVFLVAVFPVIINTSTGVRSVDGQLFRLGKCFGASDLRIFRTIALPGSVPFILSGLRLAIGQALIGVFVAELLGAQHGVGQRMTLAGDQFQTAAVFAGLIIFALAGLVLTGVLRGIERHYESWRA